MHRLTRVCLRFPALATCALLAVTLLFAAGLPKLRTEFGSRVLIGDDHPAIRTLDSFLQRYGGGVPLYIAWECGEGRPCQSVFDDASLRMAHELTTSLASHDAVSSVRSPSNSPILISTREGLAVRRFVENGSIASDRDSLARSVYQDPLWTGNLISPDGRVGVLILQPVASRSATDETVVAAVIDAIAPFDDFDFALVGEAFGNIIGGRELAESTGMLIPFMVLVIGVVIFVQTRSWQAVVSSLLMLGVALLWTFGLLGWIGWPRDSILEILAPLLLIVGVCDAIHLFSAYADDGLSSGSLAERSQALERAAMSVNRPCVLTTATTGVAFLSFATSDLDTFERFGTISAIGVVFCLVLTFSLLPLMLRILPAHGPGADRTSDTWRSILRSTVRTAERRSRSILIFSAVVVVAAAYSWASYLRVDTSRQELFGENSRILEWVHFFEQNLRPSFGIEMDVALPEGSSVLDPEALDRVSLLVSAMREQPRVGKVLSIIPFLERLNAALTNGANEGALPATAEGNAELLELLGLEDPDLLASWVGFDRRHLRISVDVEEQNYAQASALMRSTRSIASAILPADWRTEITGTASLAVDWVTDIQATQLRSFPTAFALVLVLVTLFLRSIPLGVLALVPAVVPVVVVLGAMGAAGLSLDVGRAMIAAVVIGIAVDDSIHFLHRYQRIRGVPGRSATEALDGAILQAGRPIVMTSLALALGFMTLTASAWGTVSGFGFFVSLSILVALLATIFLLPALLVALPGVGAPRGHE